jgi:hypothetical protein|tara:strand:- start:1226 stop:1900 length:675 start_codon:yes stop_codon:yes gene_type:complete
MRSKKQHIRLWYECLQICHAHDKYAANLKSSQAFYEEWGNVRGIKFDDWWKTRKHLFEDLYVREVTRLSKSPNTITLSIPINEKISTILTDVKLIVEKHQLKRLDELGLDPSKLKSKSQKVGKYAFSQSEIKGTFHYINLEIYKIYLNLNKPPINRQFLIGVRQALDARERSNLKRSILNLPSMSDFEKHYTKNVDLLDTTRSIRRGIAGVQKTLVNVSNGKFP